MLWSYMLCSHGPHQPSACNTCTNVTLTDKAAGKADLLATTAISMVIYCQWTQHTKWNMTHNVKRTAESPAEERRFTDMKLILVVCHVSTAAEEKPRVSQICSFSIRFHCVQIYFAFTLWKGWTSKCRWIDIQRCCLLLAYTCESKIPVFIFACNRRGGWVWVFQRETTASLNSSIGGVWSLTYDRQRLSCLDFKRKRSPQMLTSSETKWQLQWRVGWLSVYTEVVFAF